MKSNCLLSLLILTCVSLWCATTTAQSWPDLQKPGANLGGGGKDAAILIGIDDYWGVPDVSGADDNVLAWAIYLHKMRGVPLARINILQNQQATKEDIEAALSKTAKQVKKGGTLWFVFVGHGAASKDGKDGMLIGADAKNTPNSIYARSLSREDALKRLSRGKQARTVAILDTCFSGQGVGGQSLVAGLQPLIPSKQGPLPLHKLFLFTAGSANQFAGPLPGATRPAFSYLMLGALRGWGDANGDGKVTAQEARDYSYGTLNFLLRGSRAQTPQLNADKPQQALITSRRLEKGPDIFAMGTGAATPDPTPDPDPVNVDAPQGVRGGPMVPVPAGYFLMGADDQHDDEKPRRSVYLDAYWIDTYEVTVAQYKECVSAGVCEPPKKVHSDSSYYNYGASGRDKHPINGVDWVQSQAYCQWAGKGLPTEVQWGKAARGTEGWTYPWSEASPGCNYAVMDKGGDDGDGCGRDSTWPVGSKPAGKSPYGAYDMAGNVWEWTADWYDSSYYSSAPKRNPKGPKSGSDRVGRGGSWGNGGGFLRASNRYYGTPASAVSRLGFRCVR